MWPSAIAELAFALALSPIATANRSRVLERRPIATDRSAFSPFHAPSPITTEPPALDTEFVPITTESAASSEVVALKPIAIDFFPFALAACAAVCFLSVRSSSSITVAPPIAIELSPIAFAEVPPANDAAPSAFDAAPTAVARSPAALE